MALSHCTVQAVITSWLACRYCQPMGALQPLQMTSIRVYKPVDKCSWRGCPDCSRFTVLRMRKAGSCAPMYPSHIMRPQLATSRLSQTTLFIAWMQGSDGNSTDLIHCSCQSGKAYSCNWSLEAAAVQVANCCIRTRTLCTPSWEHHLVRTAHIALCVAGGPVVASARSTTSPLRLYTTTWNRTCTANLQEGPAHAAARNTPPSDENPRSQRYFEQDRFLLVRSVRDVRS